MVAVGDVGAGGDEGEVEPASDEPAHLDVGELVHLAEQEGLAGLKVAAELLEEELRTKSKLRRAIELIVSAGIVVLIFVRFIPSTFDVEYRQVWDRLAEVGAGAVVLMVVVWLTTMWCYAGVLGHGLPGLTRLQGMVMNFSGSALSNVVPFGGAAGVGAAYAQGLSWGFDVPSVTLMMVVTGVWNVFVKLGLPVLALTALLVIGHDTKGLGAAALVGLAALVGGIVLFGLIFRSEGLARSIGSLADRVVGGLRRLVRRPGSTDLTGTVLEFRAQSIGLVRAHWKGLSVWMVLYKLGQASLAVLCARAVGVEADTVEILAVYAFGELLSTIPLTPSGVGFVEAGSAGLLSAFGVPTDQAVAAVLLYRTFTYLLEIPLGAVGWLVWATRHRWRRPVGSMVQAPSADARPA